MASSLVCHSSCVHPSCALPHCATPAVILPAVILPSRLAVPFPTMPFPTVTLPNCALSSFVLPLCALSHCAIPNCDPSQLCPTRPLCYSCHPHTIINQMFVAYTGGAQEEEGEWQEGVSQNPDAGIERLQEGRRSHQAMAGGLQCKLSPQGFASAKVMAFGHCSFSSQPLALMSIFSASTISLNKSAHSIQYCR